MIVKIRVAPTYKNAVNYWEYDHVGTSLFIKLILGKKLTPAVSPHHVDCIYLTDKQPTEPIIKLLNDTANRIVSFQEHKSMW